jgi:hypothetical protein
MIQRLRRARGHEIPVVNLSESDPIDRDWDDHDGMVRDSDEVPLEITNSGPSCHTSSLSRRVSPAWRRRTWMIQAQPEVTGTARVDSEARRQVRVIPSDSRSPTGAGTARPGLGLGTVVPKFKFRRSRPASATGSNGRVTVPPRRRR